MTREEWLGLLMERLDRSCSSRGLSLPTNTRVACGWPSRGGTRKLSRVIGECWPRRSSADGTYEIFISPLLEDPVEVAGVLLHELVHAVLDCKFGHGAPFKRIAESLGLDGPMRATKVGPALRERLNALVAEIGPYPHAQMLLSQQASHVPVLPADGPRRQAGRLIGLQCPNSQCRSIVYTTRKWIARYYPRLPICPCGAEFSRHFKSVE